MRIKKSKNKIYITINTKLIISIDYITIVLFNLTKILYV